MARKAKPKVAKRSRQFEFLTDFDRRVVDDVAKLGGFFNAHAHLDRANTLGAHYLGHIGTTPIEAANLPLSAKQNLVGDLHTGAAYTKQDLWERMAREIERQIALGVTRLDTNIDATPDLPESGLLAVHVALELKAKYRGQIDLRIAPTPIFGFKRDKSESPSRWEVFMQAAELCDYLSLLPEKDDPQTDGRIGFKRHVHDGLELARKLGREVQFHTDQANNPGEDGTIKLLEVLEGFEQPQTGSNGPSVWVTHMISPSAYPEDRFRKLLDRLTKENVGVIVCPTAALSMRQLRSLDAPIHNSIARVAELIKYRIPLRLGTDNIADVFVPQGDGDMLTEVKAGALATRIAPPSLWAKLGAGIRPNQVDIATIGRLLYEDRKACGKVNQNWTAAIE